jgi:hypothetical protein
MVRLLLWEAATVPNSARVTVSSLLALTGVVGPMFVT